MELKVYTVLYREVLYGPLCVKLFTIFFLEKLNMFFKLPYYRNCRFLTKVLYDKTCNLEKKNIRFIDGRGDNHTIGLHRLFVEILLKRRLQRYEKVIILKGNVIEPFNLKITTSPDLSRGKHSFHFLKGGRRISFLLQKDYWPRYFYKYLP